jgi:bifunctional DNA-binding transcriptional regulator/antitoxin component of YhaV-PrlF toxin-antitoxin module
MTSGKATMERQGVPVTLKMKMTVIVKPATDLVVPRSVRRRAGIKVGDRLEFKVSGGVINIVPKLPSADDQYTPEQRRIVNARLAESKDDLKKGRTLGPFETHEAMIAFLHGAVKEARGRKKNAKRKAQ